MVGDQVDIDRQMAHRFDEELPIPRAVATGKDAARVRANIRPEELEAWENGSPLEVTTLPGGGRVVTPS